jgi:catechol 2,3-dioxygenase-like lactoylglutathione lyase family enzyme
VSGQEESREAARAALGGPAGPLSLHHVCVIVSDVDAARSWYATHLGLSVHPTKPNWLLCGRHGAVHLLPRPPWGAYAPPRSGAHLAIHVEALEPVRDRLLAAGLRPYQQAFDWSIREIESREDVLDWGLGTLFVDDPDGNTIEFVQAQRGIFAEHRRDDM